MPAVRRWRSYLPRPLRLGSPIRRAASGTLLYLARVIDPSISQRRTSTQPPIPLSPEPAPHNSLGDSASSHIATTQPSTGVAPSSADAPSSSHEQSLHVVPAALGDPHLQMPSPPPSPPPATVHYDTNTGTPPMPDATYSAYAESLPPSAPASPAHNATYTPPVHPPLNYDMTPQGAPAVLASPPQEPLAHPMEFQPPASVTVTPQHHGFVLQAFVPSPIQRQLRAATPPTISPRVVLGHMGVGVFFNPDELVEGQSPVLGVMRTPRASPRASPYDRATLQRSTRRTTSMPDLFGGNAVASSSRIGPSGNDDRDGMEIDAQDPRDIAPRAPMVGPSIAPEDDSLDSQYNAPRDNAPPIASTSRLSPVPPASENNETPDNVQVMAAVEPRTPPSAPPTMRWHARDLPPTPTIRHLDAQAIAPSDAANQPGGPLGLIAGQRDVIGLEDEEIAHDEAGDEVEVEVEAAEQADVDAHDSPANAPEDDDSFDWQNASPSNDILPIASTSRLSPVPSASENTEIPDDVQVMTAAAEPATPPSAPPTMRSRAGDIPPMPTDRHLNEQVLVTSNVAGQPGGPQGLETGHEDEQMADGENVDDVSGPGSPVQLLLHESGIHDAYISTLHELHALADGMHIPQPQDSMGEDIVRHIAHSVFQLEDELNDALNVAQAAQTELETLRGGHADISSIYQVIDRVYNDLKRSTEKMVASRSTPAATNLALSPQV
ncbi:unnamed protein product [Peniophora sp. CBMAI 1063]|nr:unnamed protein product [Peniophora sp. CBMAI 1063]